MPYFPPPSSGSGAPTDATYVTQTANGTLSAEQALSSLATGYMKVTTTTGVVTSQAVPIPSTDGGTGATDFQTALANLGGMPWVHTTGASQGAGSSGVTWQVLSSNAAANSTTTPATVMTTTSVGSGTWVFKYVIRYQSAATTTGVDFAINHTGTVTAFAWSSWFPTTGGTAATGAADQVQSNTANMVEGKAQRTLDAKGGATLSVDTANADMLYIIEGYMIVTANGDLELKHASEVAASSQVMAGTSLELKKMS